MFGERREEWALKTWKFIRDKGPEKWTEGYVLSYSDKMDQIEALIDYFETHEEYEICDKARDQIMPEFIYFDDDSDRFIMDESKLEELNTDGEHYFVIEIEEPKQKYMFDQIQNNWQLMSKLNLDVD